MRYTVLAIEKKTTVGESKVFSGKEKEIRTEVKYYVRTYTLYEKRNDL